MPFFFRTGAVLVMAFATLFYTPHAQAGSISLCPVLGDIAPYQEKGNEDYAMLISGQDGWLFRSRLDLKFRFRITDRTKDSFRRLNDAFRHTGTDVVAIMLPTRGIVHHDKLAPPYTENYDAEQAKKNYLAMIRDFSKTGMIMADMSGVDTVPDYFLQDDNHWTQDAARFSAKQAAEAIKKLDVYDDLKKTKFETVSVPGEARPPHRYLEFVNSHCGTNYAGAPLKQTFDTRQTGDDASEDKLFADETNPEVVLLGTSNLTNPEPSYANFEGFIKEDLQADVLNMAVSGGSLQGSISNYLLTGMHAKIKPKVIIWEMNSYYGFNRQDFLREIVPAVYGQCSDANALARMSGNVEPQMTTVLTNLAPKKFTTHKYYVVLNLSDKGIRDINIKFIQSDGRTDTLKLERPARSFPQNPGIYFAELSDVMPGPLGQVVLETKSGNGAGTFDARICQAPEVKSYAPTVTAEGKKLPKSKIAQKFDAVISGLKAKYTHWKNDEDYAVKPVTQVKTAPAPKLPDFNVYTPANVMAKMPPLRAGDVKIENMQGAAPLRKYAFDKRLDEFRNIQGRVEPKAIHIYSGVYDIHSLMTAVNDPKILTEKPEGYVLRFPIAVYPDATLIIKGLNKPLLMSQDNGAFIASAGNVFVIDSTVMGWNEKNKTPAQLNADNKNFRPFITMWDGSHIYAVRSVFNNLGYAASKSYGLTISTNDVVQEEFEEAYGDLPPPTGWLMDSSFSNMYFGFYTYEAKNIVVVRNTYKDNVIYAIDPHDRSDHLIIAYNKISGSKKKHGIILSREVNNSFVVYNTVERNKGSGIMLDRNSSNTVVAYNTIRYNKGDGITVYESPNNLLYDNIMERNDGNAIRIRNSWNITVVGGKSVMNKDYAFNLYEDPLEGRGRDFEMDPVTTRASATINGVLLENNRGVAKADGLESLRFQDVSLNNSSLNKNLFGGDLAELEKDLTKIMNKNAAIEVAEKK